MRAANNPQIGDDSYISYQRVNIPDLITTKWHQGYPYNAAIPSSDPQIRYPTGCTATAIAQIMNYWKYPQSGIGSKSYTDWNGNDIFADFEHTTYDWANMLDSYDENATQTQIDAVATLTYHIGASLNTQYGQDGSSTQASHSGLSYSGPEAPTLVETFGYDSNLIVVGRAHYSTKEWERLIYDELILGRPVLYNSIPQGEFGHEFIIHGYDAGENMFSVNWGWGGPADGYYSLSGLNTNLYFEEGCDHYALLGIQPPGRERNLVERGDRFEYNGLYFKVVSPTHKTVELSYEESREFRYFDPIEIPSYVYYLGEEYVVDRLGYGALKNKSTAEYDYYKYTEFCSIFYPAGPIAIVEFPENLRSLGSEALSHINIESIDLTNVANISQNALSEAYIKEIVWPCTLPKIPESCFSGSVFLEKITIPEGVVEIAGFAFSSCKKLKEIKLPNSLTYIDFGAFQGCAELTRIEIPENVTFVGLFAFKNCNKLYDFVCYTPEPPLTGNGGSTSLFVGIASTKDVGTLYVPRNSISLYQDAKYWGEWQNIMAIEDMPETTLTGKTFSVDGIEYMILANHVVANGLTEDINDIVIPSQVENDGVIYNVDGIADGAFEGCDIHNVTIEEGCRYIGVASFSKCPLGGDINIPNSVQEIRQYAFGDYSLHSDLTHLTLPEGLKFIGVNAFEASKIENIIIPASVEYIELGALSRSTVKTLVIKGGSLKWIDRICLNAEELKHVILPEDFMTISSVPSSVWGDLGGEFQDCNNLEDIVLHYCPLSLDDLTTRFHVPPFVSDFSQCVLYVPAPSVDIYKSSPDWNIFKDILPIVPLTEITISDENISLEVNESASLEIIATPVDATVTHCTWASSDPAVASVDQYGVVTAHKPGTATITAKSLYYPDLSAACKVTVSDKFSSGIVIDDAKDDNNDDAYYDMMGRRVVNPTRGIYIRNGKKVFVK